MPTQELPGMTALVTGLSRGSGHTIAVALSSRGAHVAGVAGDPGRLEELHAQPGGTFTPAGASARSAGPPTSEVSQPRTGGAPPGVRAQLLATEHWSLLATRSMAQSEALSRITTFLTLVSASIVSLALIGQFTRFDQRFATFALVLLGMLVLIGTLTKMRAGNASIEDLAHVIGMNRLRAAYVELAPGIERYLVTSAHDDDNGLWQTYIRLGGRRPIWQPLASSWMFIAFVNSGLTWPARRHSSGRGWLVLPRRLRSPGDTAIPAHTATVRRVVPRTRHAGTGSGGAPPSAADGVGVALGAPGWLLHPGRQPVHHDRLADLGHLRQQLTQAGEGGDEGPVGLAVPKRGQRAPMAGQAGTTKQESRASARRRK